MKHKSIFKTIGKILLIIIVPIGVLVFIQYICTIPIGSYICKVLPFVKALNKNYPHPENWVSWLISIYVATISTFLTISFRNYEKKKKKEEEKRLKEKNIVEWAKYLSFSTCILPKFDLESTDDILTLLLTNAQNNYICLRLNSYSKIPINFNIDISKIEIELSRVISGGITNENKYFLEENTDNHEIENASIVKVNFGSVSSIKNSPECLYEISSFDKQSQLNFYFRYDCAIETSNQKALNALESIDTEIDPINHFVITLTCKLYDILLDSDFDAQFYNLILEGRARKNKVTEFEIYNIYSSKQSEEKVENQDVKKQKKNKNKGK